MKSTFLFAFSLFVLLGIPTVAEANRPPPKKQIPDEDTLPHYKIPQDTYADLIAAPGSPSIGQPKINVGLYSQVRKNHRTNKTAATQHLILHAGSFVGGKYKSLELYIGCQPPVKGAPAPKGSKKSSKQDGQDTALTPATSSNATTPANQALSFNLTRNCRMGYNQLDVICEVALQHLARLKGLNTGCRAKGSDHAFECGQKLKVAVHATATKDVGDGTKAGPFDLWAKGGCVTGDKQTSRNDPTCDQNGDMAQYFEVEVTCNPKGNK
ncbi:hypothetical protein GQ53DRAFT_835025 [Thozetella sp. PMI_491]|nr:hypothetical protein GQ53DRAFT_835025 [Thozetella sp. PMI_491]